MILKQFTNKELRENIREQRAARKKNKANDDSIKKKLDELKKSNSSGNEK